MSELDPSRMPAYAQRLFDYYLGNARDAENRTEYIRRGLIPTNSLSLLIVDDPHPELVPGSGIPNPHDYRRQPFGHLIEALKMQEPVLWERAKQTADTTSALMDLYWRTIAKDRNTESSEAKALAAQHEVAHWEKAEVYTQVIEILGPQLEAMGIDPVVLCG